MARLHKSLRLWLLLALTPVAHATVKWVTPTPEELAMTADPKAPGAPAVFLSYEESQTSLNHIIVHARIKVLTAEGFSAANVEVPYTVLSEFAAAEAIDGRTIHPDGTIIPFTGKPFEKVSDTTIRGTRISKVITLPDVTVGSIIEFAYAVDIKTTFPTWYLQQRYFAHAVHFSFTSSDGYPADNCHWASTLPSGVRVTRVQAHFVVDATDVPAILDDDYPPPRNQFLYNVSFFYNAGDPKLYWAHVGEFIYDDWSRFDAPKKHLTKAVNKAIAAAGATTEEQKLRTLYDLVMHMENTDFTRQRTTREDKAARLKELRNADDIWARQRGDSAELTLLFVALARAADLQVSPMAVASRDHTVFNEAILDSSQFDSIIAVATVEGRKIFLDPGERYCPFGHLVWWHSGATGISFEGQLLVFRYTATEPYKAAETQRIVSLHIGPDSHIEGVVHVTLTGTAGLGLRQKYLREDKLSVGNAMEKDLQALAPVGTQIRLKSFTGLEEYESPLVADFTVDGTLGTLTSSRLLLPAHFFQTTRYPRFVHSTRTVPVVFPLPYSQVDVFRLVFPPEFAVEITPTPKTIKLDAGAVYDVDTKLSPDHLVTQRHFSLSKLNFAPDQYPRLRSFYADVATQDQEQIALRHTPAK